MNKYLPWLVSGLLAACLALLGVIHLNSREAAQVALKGAEDRIALLEKSERAATKARDAALRARQDAEREQDAKRQDLTDALATERTWADTAVPPAVLNGLRD